MPQESEQLNICNSGRRKRFVCLIGAWSGSSMCEHSQGKSRCKVEVAAYVTMAGEGADARSARHKNV
jgi:hypothetical protein